MHVRTPASELFDTDLVTDYEPRTAVVDQFPLA